MLEINITMLTNEYFSLPVGAIFTLAPGDRALVWCRTTKVCRHLSTWLYMKVRGKVILFKYILFFRNNQQGWLELPSHDHWEKIWISHAPNSALEMTLEAKQDRVQITKFTINYVDTKKYFNIRWKCYKIQWNISTFPNLINVQ